MCVCVCVCVCERERERETERERELDNNIEYAFNNVKTQDTMMGNQP